AQTGSSTKAIEARSLGGSEGMITRSAVLTACSREAPSGVSITWECSWEESSVATNGITISIKVVPGAAKVISVKLPVDNIRANASALLMSSANGCATGSTPATD